MGVNTEMHDCEPAMTQAQHFNLSYSPHPTHPTPILFFSPALPLLHPRVDYPHYFGLRELHAIHPFASTQLYKKIKKCTMDDTDGSDLLITAQTLFFFLM